MKKTIAVTAAFLLSLSAMSVNTVAAEETDAKVYVTISDGNALVLAQEEVTLTDADGDGALTINDTLFIAHENRFDGGAAAGYASSEGQFGLMLNKLWGIENGGSYGYYVDNKAANSLGDTIEGGEYINAFVYSDTTSWSDTYGYFDKHTAEGTEGDELTLTLKKAAFDENWNPVELPVEGASILVNGKATSFSTDAEGKVTLTLLESGSLTVSATSSSETLVPPVCEVEVEANADVTTEVTTTAETTTSRSTGTTPRTAESMDSRDIQVDDSSPATGDHGTGIAVAVLGAAVAVAFAAKRRNED